MVEEKILDIDEELRTWGSCQEAYDAIGTHYKRMFKRSVLLNISGKLHWQGDPLQEQQKLRSEW